MNDSRRPERSVEARVLGQLILVESALHALPDVERIAGFVCQGLRAVPGVAGAALCQDGRIVAALGEWRRDAEPGAVPCDCGASGTCLHGAPGTTSSHFALDTANGNLGSIALLVHDPASLAPYVPYVQNVANVVAISIENRLQQQRLVDLNVTLASKVAELERVQVELRDAKRLLESAVESRTAELGAATASLRESEAWLLLAQEAANLGTWEYDFASRTLRATGAVRHLLGAPLEGRVPVERLYERIHPEDLEPLRRAIRRAVADRTSLNARFRIGAPDGGERWLLAQGRSEYRADGAPLRVLGVDLDVTEQRRLEEEVLQANKLESIGRLAGGVAHDLNNLLTVILGSAEAARLEPATADEPIAEVVAAAERAAALTRQLLAFARRQPTRPRSVDVNAEVQTLARLLARLIGESIELSLSLDANPWPVVIDPGHLGQVLTNLVTNARDAMPRGGRLTVSTRNVPASGAEPDRVALEVTDTGSGMGPEVLAHLFEPFYSTKPTGRGTGLGLASSYGLATQAGGRIQVESVVGKGSTFTVLLPRADGPVAAAPPEGPQRHLGRGTETILVVDDDASVRRMATRALAGLGYRVLEASEAREALDVAARHEGSIDALVSDVVMPGPSGPELAEALRATRPRLRSLFVSGYPSEPLGPGLAFLEKPFTGELLARRLRELLDAPT